MSNCYEIPLPLVARVRHSVHNLETFAHSLIDGAISWPHELIAESSVTTDTAHLQITQTSTVAACILPLAARRS